LDPQGWNFTGEGRKRLDDFVIAVVHRKQN
jgi:hypothetical protein